MKFSVVLFCGLVAVAHAGVGILDPAAEAEALHLFVKICASRAEGGDIGGARIWCKFAPGELQEDVNHEVVIPAPVIPDNIVFVQPPPVVYRHNVAVTGETAIAPKTKIYVLPQKSTHSITSQYNPGTVITSKPTVYFLKTSGGEGYRYGTPAPPGVAGYA